MRRESDMRLPICRWLYSQGYAPCLEVVTLRNCDVVGVRFAGRMAIDAIAVELKLRNVAAVLRQCREHIHSGLVSRVYAAMPVLPAKAVVRCDNAQVGLLVVCPDGLVREIIGSRVAQCPHVSRLSNQWPRREQWKQRANYPNMRATQ